GFVHLGASTLFSAQGGLVGEELWRTDGTAAGTVLLGDAYPGSQGSAPMFLGRLGDQAYFSAMNFATGREPWATDGTAGSLHLLADLVPGSESSDPKPAGSAGGRLFFWTNVETTDAALHAAGADGTVVTLASVEAPNYFSSGFAAVGSLGLFGADLKDGRGVELGATDGTPEGTRTLRDLSVGDPSADPRQLTRFGGRVLFTAIDDAHGREVWRTDGTGAGTRLVADLRPGNGPGFPNFLAPTGSGVVLEAQDGSIRHVRAAGGGIDLLFRPASAVRASRRGFGLGGQAYFFTPVGSAENPRFELWRSDGHPGATLRLAEIAGFDRFFGYRVDSGPDPERGRAFFIPSVIDVQSGLVPEGLWITNGSETGTRRVLDNPCVGCSGKIGEAILGPGGRFVYTVDDRGEDVSRLWASDGTGAGTVQLAESPNLIDGDPIRSLARWGDLLLFAASDPEHGQELWVSDGTPAGTRLLADLRPGPAPSWPDGITVVGNRAFFSADDGMTGRELWATDGTEEGTYRVADLRQGTRSSAPQSFTAIGNRLVFAAADDRYGLEVWSSDGTAAGTRLVSDVQVGRLPSSPSDFLVLGSDLLFVASRLGTGRELFRLPLSALGAP
ncbi:MAG TPA: ELWxxDGT repeat protein, partial [Thermoanaerobaculia bacterium]|nr:ELWxxDGT repeat protein [Thermoanaerobaculia bacterium]